MYSDSYYYIRLAIPLEKGNLLKFQLRANESGAFSLQNLLDLRRFEPAISRT